MLALNALFELGMDRKQMASLCMKAENEFVGVASGIMDQYASLLCEVGHALLVDCRSLEEKNIPLDLEDAGLTLLVCDTRVERGTGRHQLQRPPRDNSPGGEDSGPGGSCATRRRRTWRSSPATSYSAPGT